MTNITPKAEKAYQAFQDAQIYYNVAQSNMNSVDTTFDQRLLHLSKCAQVCAIAFKILDDLYSDVDENFKGA